MFLSLVIAILRDWETFNEKKNVAMKDRILSEKRASLNFQI